jgi:hypothetical protein
MKGFARLSYDNANGIGPSDSLSNFRNQINVPAAVLGLDWNHGRFVNSARFGYQKMVNAITPDLADSVVFPTAPFPHSARLLRHGAEQRRSPPDHSARSFRTLRQPHPLPGESHDPLWRRHSLHRPGRLLRARNFAVRHEFEWLDVINAINSNPNLFPLFPGDPRGAADNPLNYPVGTITIFNGLGNFSEHSAFNRPTGGHADTRIEGYIGDTFNLFPNLNISFGVNYVRDSGRTNSDLARRFHVLRSTPRL